MGGSAGGAAAGPVPARFADDPDAFLSALVTATTRVLPDAVGSGTLVVDRERSLGDRLAGRPGAVSGLRLVAPGETLTLVRSGGSRWASGAERVSGGVTISRRTLPLGAWMPLFAGAVAALAADAAGDARAVSSVLEQLGIQPAGADVSVGEATLQPDLLALAARLEGRIPPDAHAAVARIVRLLVDALPRVTGSGEPAVTLLRAATIYLPDTLRTYLTLPADWARDHVFSDGTTAASALLQQLDVLEAGVAEVREAAVARDARALADNGRFLAARFENTGIELA